MSETTLAALARAVGGRLEGDGARPVRGVAPIERAGPEEVTFVANPRYEKHLANTRAAAVIVAEDYAGSGPEGVGLIRCKDPYFAFREAMVAFYGFREPQFEGVDERADIHPTAAVAEGARIAPFVTVSAEAAIGSGSVLYPGVYVGPRSRIGRDCTVHPNVTLYDGTVLGDRVTIHAGSSIGQDGFGYATHAGADGVTVHAKIPQAGWVELEDDVEIGACCAIDRATMGPTVVGAGSKFSNLIAIGHGTRLGRHCLVVAQAGLAGSVTAGDYCVFAGQCGCAGHIRIGEGAKVAGQSGVTNDVAAGEEVFGTPAIPIADARRAMISFSRLPQLRSAVRTLTRQLAALKRQVEEMAAAEGGKS
jgi:UDP-3-O-[3-hydroxymyristoyl] glucosamine N-acyltransferase